MLWNPVWHQTILYLMQQAHSSSRLPVWGSSLQRIWGSSQTHIYWHYGMARLCSDRPSQFGTVLRNCRCSDQFSGFFHGFLLRGCVHTMGQLNSHWILPAMFALALVLTNSTSSSLSLHHQCYCKAPPPHYSLLFWLLLCFLHHPFLLCSHHPLLSLLPLVASPLQV